MSNLFGNICSRPSNWCRFRYYVNYSTGTKRTAMRDTMKVFDKHAKFLQRERAARLPSHEQYDFLKEKIGFQLADRVLDVKLELSNALDLGCGKGLTAKHIKNKSLKHLTMVDSSPAMLSLSATPPAIDGGRQIEVTKRVVDEEQPLPFDNESFDLVYSNLCLHWVNDIPSLLTEVRRTLRPDGVFFASMLGGDTLFQLRSSLVLAELEREGGFSSHISPFTEVKDVASLLNTAGFTLVTIDLEDLTVGYSSLFALIEDLQGMGDSNASIKRKPMIHRDTLFATAAIYEEMYGKDGVIPATFQIIYMVGWKPNPKKPVVAAQPGSATVSMKDINRLNELIREHGMQGRVEYMKEMIETEHDETNKNSASEDPEKSK